MDKIWIKSFLNCCFEYLFWFTLYYLEAQRDRLEIHQDDIYTHRYKMRQWTSQTNFYNFLFFFYTMVDENLAHQANLADLIKLLFWSFLAWNFLTNLNKTKYQLGWVLIIIFLDLSSSEALGSYYKNFLYKYGELWTFSLHRENLEKGHISILTDCGAKFILGFGGSTEYLIHLIQR